MSSATYRYVPQGPASRSSDAPGYSTEATKGPVCWKCRGACTLALRAQDRKKQKTSINADKSEVSDKDCTVNKRACPVCSGRGHLPIRSLLTKSQSGESEGGCITARRRRPLGWRGRGHIPPAVQACINLANDPEAKHENSMEYALSLLSQANGTDDDYYQRKDVPISPTNFDNFPSWLPISKGEQLCNLVGKWRILQRIGSHRWTTDDLITAYVAGSVFTEQFTQEGGCPSFVNVDSSGELSNAGVKREIRYLDLGTGNGSVLQMVTWYLLSKLSSKYSLQAVGVEARSEAVGLARRSLAFNLGSCEYADKAFTGVVIDANDKEFEPMKYDVKVVQGDFRDLISLSAGEQNSKKSQSDTNEELKEVASQQYDLITGTPPYFRVDFSSDKESSDQIAAVINQGGMPTSMQSAPARCEVS